MLTLSDGGILRPHNTAESVRCRPFETKEIVSTPRGVGRVERVSPVSQDYGNGVGWFVYVRVGEVLHTCPAESVKRVVP
jgi:hypothetical protein